MNWIRNKGALAINKNRESALAIMESGFSAINTEQVVSRSVRLEGDILRVLGQSFDLTQFKTIKVVGFGKSSPMAALALEQILGSRIKSGAVIGLEKADLKNIETFAGTHPKPSQINVLAGEKIYELAKNSGKEDLVIALVSGGGSSLLCYDAAECGQEMKLYDAFLASGQTINEINTVRKHLSPFKGGGLAKIAYPATVIGLIFSDVPGDHFDEVASGPTYKDESTVSDAEKIISQYHLGHFDLIETPKEEKYFEKVSNFALVSNKTAVAAMNEKSTSLGFETKILSTALYDDVAAVAQKIFSARGENTVVLAAGEPEIKVAGKIGKGGRNVHLALLALASKLVESGSVFISFASDGRDNSDAAGAVVDMEAVRKASQLGLDAQVYFDNFDSYNFFQKTGDLIITGETGANVSDLMILLTKK